MSPYRYLPPGGPVPTRCVCEPGQYDDMGLPVPGSGVSIHPECPLHGDDPRAGGPPLTSAKAEMELSLRHRGYGD